MATKSFLSPAMAQTGQLNTGFVLGARVPLHVTAPGILMLALQSDEAIERWLAADKLKTFTSHTLTDQALLRTRIKTIRMQELVFVRTAARSVLPRGGSAPTRPQRRGGGRLRV